MPKGKLDRLNETLNQIPVIANSHPGLFTNVSAGALRTRILETLRDDPYFDLDEISDDIGLGGVRIIKFSSETALRHMKRVILLLHRVPGYHSSAQTRLYKTQIADLNETRTLAELSTQLSRGVRLIYDSLQDWLTKTLAVDGGALLHYYNQGEDNRLTAMDITDNGWCLGVSTQWIRFKATGRMGFWNWARSEEGAAAFRFVMAAQGIRLRGTQVDRYHELAGFALRRFGIMAEQVNTCDTPAAATPAAMATNLLSVGPRYCLILQRYTTGGGHAMAVANVGPILFMDPNAGEVGFSSAGQLSSWLPKFVRRIGYNFSFHQVNRYGYHPDMARVDQPKPETLEGTMRDAMAERRTAMGY